MSVLLQFYQRDDLRLPVWVTLLSTEEAHFVPPPPLLCIVRICKNGRGTKERCVALFSKGQWKNGKLSHLQIFKQVKTTHKQENRLMERGGEKTPHPMAPVSDFLFSLKLCPNSGFKVINNPQEKSQKHLKAVNIHWDLEFDDTWLLKSISIFFFCYLL